MEAQRARRKGKQHLQVSDDVLSGINQLQASKKAIRDEAGTKIEDNEKEVPKPQPQPKSSTTITAESQYEEDRKAKEKLAHGKDK